jgi:hypothetical protein
MVKDEGSGWLRWLLKQGGITKAYSNHKAQQGQSCALGLPFASLSFYLSLSLIQEALGLVNISKRKARRMQTAVVVTQHLKGDGRFVTHCSGFLKFYFLILMSEPGPLDIH